MTILGTLADALAAADRGFSALRRAWQTGPAGAGSAWPPLMIPLGGGSSTTELSGENRLVSYAESVATYPVIYAVWSKLLRNLASTDVAVYRQRDDRTLERAHGTSLETLLREPAPGKGLVDLLQWLFNPYLVEGNGLLGKFRGNGPDRAPTNLIPLDWRYMTALARPGGPVEYWVSYQIGDARVIDPAEVVHLAWYSPDGSPIGPSPLRALGTTVRLTDVAQQFHVKSFDNGARPTGAVVLPADSDAGPEERKEMREEVERNTAGIDNAFRVMVLSGGAEWKQMSFSAVDAELINTRNVTRDEVCVAYDCKRSVIAEPEGGSSRAVQEILRDFQRSLQPHTRLAESILQRQLIDPEPEWADERLTVRFDLSDLLRGTFSEEVQTAVYAFVNGLFSQDESRERIDYPALDTEDSRTPRIPHAQLAPGVDGRSLPPSTETQRGLQAPPPGAPTN
jgi:HK97 family phage portal protein